jgi:hypothetical protein
VYGLDFSPCVCSRLHWFERCFLFAIGIRHLNSNFESRLSERVVYQVDTTRPFTVRTQFVTADGTDNGALSEIRRTYVQNGKTIENSQVVRNAEPQSIAACAI